MNKPQRLITASVVVVFLVAAALLPQGEPPPPLGMPSVAAPIEVVNALFARKKIEKGTHFDTAMHVVEHIELKKNIPKDALPAGRVLSSYRDLHHLVALEDIARGEPILGLRFASPAEIGRLVSTEEPLR